MRTKLFIILLLAASLAGSGAGQEPSTVESGAKWTRLESEDKSLSISFPAEMVVDAERRSGGRRCRIISFYRGARMELMVSDDKEAKYRLGITHVSGARRVESFDKGAFRVKRISLGTDANPYETVLLADSKRLYSISVSAESSAKNELERFISSIRLNGVALFGGNVDTDPAGEAVSLSSLKTSPEVIAAYAREFEKNTRVFYEMPTDQIDRDSSSRFSRPPIILEIDYPMQTVLFTGQEKAEYRSLMIRVQLLADGRVGDLTVYSTLKKSELAAYINAARKLRFIPAQIDGQNVDSFYFVDYSSTITVRKMS